MAKRLNLSKKDIEEILKHRPDPKRKTAIELANQYSISQATIRNIWRNDGLPASKAKPPRQSQVDVKTMGLIAKAKDRDIKEVAEEFNVKISLIKRIWGALA